MNQPLSKGGAARRHLLAASGLALCGHAPARAQGAAASKNVGRKFHADGRVRAFAGNTFVGHLPQQGPHYRTFDAVLDFYRELPRHPFAAKIALLPPSSYHVTLFVGVNDDDRDTKEWVGPFDRAMPMDAINTVFRDKLRAVARSGERDFVFDIGAAPEVKRDGTVQIPLLPSGSANRQRLAALRERLSSLTGVRRPRHEHYEYHLTLGYMHTVLGQAEAIELQALSAGFLASLRQRGIQLHIPAFYYCEFRDMYAFEEIIDV